MKPFSIATIFLLFWVGACDTMAVHHYVPDQARNSEQNILIIRHAEAVCGHEQCDLTARGYKQREKLTRIINSLVNSGHYYVAEVQASNTCRTTLTVTSIADNYKLSVLTYPAREGVPDCAYQGATKERLQPNVQQRPRYGFKPRAATIATRQQSMEKLRVHQWQDLPERGQALTIIADHSNFVCKWFSAMGVPESEFASHCHDGNLDHDDFADIFWLYQDNNNAASQWHLVILDDIFEVPTTE
ncbi:MAG: hypothetical protein ACWA5L_08010 [bacterium]